MANALRQLFQRLRNALAVLFFLMQGAVHVTHGIIEQVERGRGIQPLAVRTQRRDVTQECVVQAEQAKGGFLQSLVGLRIGGHVGDDRSQLGIAVVGISPRNAVGEAVILTAVVLHQNGVR